MAQIYEIVLKNQQNSAQNNVVTEEQISVNPETSITEVKEKIKPLINANPKIKIGGGNRTGVEHDRYQRIITTIGNRFTGGQYEKTVRFANASRGAYFGNTLGFTVIGQFLFNFIDKQILTPLQRQAQERNDNDVLKIRTGNLTISNTYFPYFNLITGRRKYNTNS